MRVRLLLIRHAQSSNNADIKATGDRSLRIPEPCLTNLGLEQTARLADALPQFIDGPIRLTSSLMTRALQTGAILAEGLDLPLHTLPDLHEAGGIYDAGPHDTMRSAVAAPPLAALRAVSPRILIADNVPDPWWVGPYEPPDARDARGRRVVAALERCEAATHVVIIHQHFAQNLIRALLGIESMSGYLQIDNAATSLFERAQPGYRVRWINRTDHLPPELVTN